MTVNASGKQIATPVVAQFIANSGGQSLWNRPYQPSDINALASGPYSPSEADLAESSFWADEIAKGERRVKRYTVKELSGLAEFGADIPFETLLERLASKLDKGNQGFFEL